MKVRFLWIGVVVLFIAGVLTASSYARIDPKTAAGIWLFDEGKGDIAKDSSGKGNDGTIMGAQWTEGKFNKALQFDGVDDYVDCGSSKSLDVVDHLTLAAWVKHKPNNDGYIIMKNDVGDVMRQYGFLDYPSENKYIKFFCHTAAAGRPQNLTSPQNTSVDDDKWHHVAITIDYPNLKFFIDGVDKVTHQLPDHMISVDTSVWIGKRKPNNFPLNGIIDEVAIFNVALSESDINHI